MATTSKCGMLEAKLADFAHLTKIFDFYKKQSNKKTTTR
jgi:hypothetical protein